MKKLMSFALCIAAVGSMSAQKSNVEAAKKLSGDPSKIEEARSLINAAMQDPSTSNDAQTYFEAGDIEFNAFDKEQAMNQIKPNSADPVKMAEKLLLGYKNFLKALPLDSVPDAKGKVKPKYSKKITGKLKGHSYDYYVSGFEFFNAQKTYPEAYESFMIYADMPDMPFMKSENVQLVDSLRGYAYYCAGRAAFNGNEMIKGAEAFRKARNNGYDEKDAYVFELACWQTLAQNDSTKEQLAKEKILEVANDGNKKFGVAEPVFISNIVNFMVIDNKFDEAAATVTQLINENPDTPSLYGLRAFILDRKGDDEASLADYDKCVSLPNVDFDNLKNAAKKYYRVGRDKLNLIEGNSEADRAARMDVKTKYLDVAKNIAEKAKAMNPSDGDLLYVIENIDYSLSSFN